MAHWTAESLALYLSKSARKAGGGWLTVCPAHKDVGPSLSLMDKPGGRVIFNCLAGCDFRNVSKSLSESGIILPGAPSRYTAKAVAPPAPGAEKKARPANVWEYAPHLSESAEFNLAKLFGARAAYVTSVWEWRSVDGALLFKTVRLDEPSKAKNVVPVSPCSCKELNRQEWRMQGPAGLRPLYNLENYGEPEFIVVTEGEKAAQAAIALYASQPSIWVTTTLGGAKSPHLVDWSPVKGKTVVISHDCDHAGIAFASSVSANSTAAGAKACHLATPPFNLVIERGVPLLRSNSVPKGYDLHDAKAEGWTLPLLLTHQYPWHGPKIVSHPKKYF